MTDMETIPGEWERRDLIAIIAIFLLALGLRLFRLFDLDVWYDETMILIHVQNSFAGIWNYCKADNSPPLYSWIMKVWHTFFPGANSLRFFTALLGALTAPAAYYLGKVLLDRRLGWALGLACVLSTSLLYQQQMIRMYSLFTLFSCLSISGFVRAIQTNQWKYWSLTAVANLLGYYTFLFMGFLVVGETLVLIWLNRFGLRKYFRPVLAHFPTVLLMLLWTSFALQSARKTQEDFFLGPVADTDIVKLWVYLGTGVDFRNHYFLTFLLNLPLLAGLILCALQMRKKLPLQIGFVLLATPIMLVYLISMIGQSIFFKRYFIFLLALYLGLSLAGWLSVSRPAWRRLGLGLSLAVLLISAIYYYADYYEQHTEYSHIKPYGGGAYDGHAPSHMAEIIRGKIVPGEVVVHVGNSQYRSFSFFPMVYYHGRALPEYIYARGEVKYYFGQRYLRPGDRIKSLHDLKPPPAGIWLVSLDSIETFFADSLQVGRRTRPRWMIEDDFPRELEEMGFARMETYRRGRLTTIHFVRSRESALNSSKQ